ncbi:MAG TPA: hypothetical protein VIF57_03250 [Polyangia bacterium]|jgi:hypothetical protein
MAVLAAGALWTSACGGSGARPPSGAGGAGGQGGSLGVTGTACLERPDELPRPPGVGLPCELIPPGLRL